MKHNPVRALRKTARRAVSLVLACAFVVLSGCRTLRAASANVSQAAEAPGASRPLQCEPKSSFRGSCSVTEVGGRQGTTTEAARSSEMGKVVQLLLKVPGGETSGGVQVDLVPSTGSADGLTIDKGLDLYGRTGCLAEVNGGMFGDGFTPRVTLRLLLSLQDDARTGYAEVSDMRSGTPTHALLALKCDWQP